ncbi:MAG TPA: aldehyde dehydrogenase family protein, partial [Kribbella sp.]|nr:aldehyde dehydrogenase family protein [Kribbella sp.]
MRTVRNLIDGTPRDAFSGATSELVDPATGKVFGTAPLSSAEDVDTAYQAAAAAAPGWGGATPAERQRALLRFADLVEARADDLVAAESQNTGKPLELTRTEELAVMVDQMRFFAGAARLLEGKSAGE